MMSAKSEVQMNIALYQNERMWRLTSNVSGGSTIYYAFALKTNGWQLSKGNPTATRGEHFLATGPSPKVVIGKEHVLRVRHVGNKIELWVDGAHIGTFVDDGVQFGPVYKSGKIGLYCEDARVQWDDVKVVGV